MPSFLTGVRGLDAVERLLFQPGLAICGLVAGFSGDGPKAVIPNRALAKLEFRIVPNQTPEGVLDQMRRAPRQARLRRRRDPDAVDRRNGQDQWRRQHRHGRARVCPRAVRRADAQADRRIRRPPGRVARHPAGHSGVQTGVGPPGFRGHATDEFVTVEHYIKGIKFAAGILDRFGAST